VAKDLSNPIWWWRYSAPAPWERHRQVCAQAGIKTLLFDAATAGDGSAGGDRQGLEGLVAKGRMTRTPNEAS